MIGMPEIGTLKNAVVCGIALKGLSAMTKDGKPARFAIIDEDGTILESGDELAKELLNVSIHTFKNFLAGKGLYKVLTK